MSEERRGREERIGRGEGGREEERENTVILHTGFPGLSGLVLMAVQTHMRTTPDHLEGGDRAASAHTGQGSLSEFQNELKEESNCQQREDQVHKGSYPVKTRRQTKKLARDPRSGRTGRRGIKAALITALHVLRKQR